MYKLCVFGGTTEGRELVEFLHTQLCAVTACVATEYGGTLLPEAEQVHVSARRLPVEEIVSLLQKERFDLVVDATHPYARSITSSIARACAETNTEHLRLLREASSAPEDAVFVESTEDAATFLGKTEGNILLTTGSKELSRYAAIPDFSSRVWARVLPMQASLDACSKAGLSPSHVIAMQGPFSLELNEAMLRAIGADWLVTKDGGSTGGFPEKALAAQKTGARLLVIGRPAQEEGKTLSETIQALRARFGFSRTADVTVVGIGPGGEETQTAEVRAAISRAGCLIGAKRMLEAAARPGQMLFDAIAPEKIAEVIASHPEYASFTVVMSGDTGFFSGTKKLLPLLDTCRVRVLPGLSSMSVLCARLGVSYEDAVAVSLHGRQRDIVRDVQSNGKVFALVGGDGGMQALCRRLTDAGLGSVRVSAGERLGYPDEKITTGTASALCETAFDRLSAALIENDSPDEIITPGLPDEAFLRSLEPGKIVPMTKSEVRSVCLSKLQLTENAVCWDIGAGTGSVAAEMALLARRGSVYAVERNEEALPLLEENRKKFRLENLHIVPGNAPEACLSLPAPTHVFLGGTAGRLDAILAAALQKNPNARIVATAVTLESVGALCACMKDFSFSECVSLQVSRAKAAGPYHLMQGQNPVYIFTLQNRSEPV